MTSKTIESPADAMKTTALAQWFGSNRMLAPEVGAALAGLEWVGVIFAGGMSEVPHIRARTVAVNDLHRHVMNLARVVAAPPARAALYRALRRAPFHPDHLREAQRRCLEREALADDPDSLFAAGHPDPRFEPGPDVAWAADYFACAWMTRAGAAGTPAEFSAPPSIRWDAGGGDSAVRFRSAARGLVAWGRVLSRCTFTALDFRAFLAKCKDRAGHGLYSDATFPDVGDAYTHHLDVPAHHDLARLLAGYRHTRCVIRFYDHPLIRRLYPAPHWTWRHLAGGRRQTNDAAPEVLLTNSPEPRDVPAAD